MDQISVLIWLRQFFSALGTAFTPISTVHALTAGASITSGWKTAVDSDIYAKLTIQNLVLALGHASGVTFTITTAAQPATANTKAGQPGQAVSQ